MKVPKNIVVQTKEWVQIMTKVSLYVSVYGCETVNYILDTVPLRRSKRHGRNAGAYIINKVCQEYKITQYDLFESTARRELTEARQLLCVLIEKHLGFSKTEISSHFNRSRHFAKRMIHQFNKKLEENHPIDKKVIDRYKKLDRLVTAYMEFKPKNQA